ncbi:MFS transporter [Paraburkholderia madseniana]
MIRVIRSKASDGHVQNTAARRSRTLDRRASFWVSFGVSTHTLWTSAAPALSYRLYAQKWNLSLVDTAGVFTIYPIFVVSTLVLLGGLSDQVGRRMTMLIALTCSLVGVLVMTVAPDIRWLLVGRALMGIGVGLGSGSSTAAILEFSSDEDPERSAAATNIAQGIGFATGLLLGGALIQYAPWPLQLNFLVLAVVIVVLIVGVWFMPRHGGQDTRWSVRMPRVPADCRNAFAIASLAAVIAFASGAILLSLGGQVAHDLVGSVNAFTNGAILASFAIVSAVITVLCRKLSPRLLLLLGAITASLGLLLLWLAVSWVSLSMLLASTSLAGGGYALLFMGALSVLNSSAPAEHRGGILSAFYLIGYLSMGMFALVLGGMARTWGLAEAVTTASFTIVALGFVSFWLSASRPFPVFRRYAERRAD